MKVKLLTLAFLMMAVSCSLNERTKGIENGYVWVDLGLSVKWATMNVGATEPENYGKYFAWGETAEKNIYSWDTYKYCQGSYETMTKYCYIQSFDTVDRTILEPEDDAAYVNWGGKWRMPTNVEWTELRLQCTWTWTTQNSVNGYLVTAKNGNSIFLPAAGCCHDADLYNVGSYGDYWSSSLSGIYSNYASSIYFDSNDVGRGYGRCYGQSVRPVCP